MRVSLALLNWNELEGCKIDVPRLPREAFDEVYAIDGGSTDGSVDFLVSQGIPVYQQAKRGLNSAYHAVVEHSTCDAVVVFFPKGNLPTEDLLKFLPYFENGYDLVVASRVVKGSKNEEDDQTIKPRKWGVMALSMLISLTWRREGYRIRDVLHGFKGFSVEGFKMMAPLDYGLSIDLEMVARSYRLRLKRIEFPTTERSRTFGQTHFKILPTGIKLVKYYLSELSRR